MATVPEATASNTGEGTTKSAECAPPGEVARGADRGLVGTAIHKRKAVPDRNRSLYTTAKHAQTKLSVGRAREAWRGLIRISTSVIIAVIYKSTTNWLVADSVTPAALSVGRAGRAWRGLGGSK